MVCGGSERAAGNAEDGNQPADVGSGTELQVYADDNKLQGEVKSVKLGKKQTVKVTIPCNGGLMMVNR